MKMSPSVRVSFGLVMFTLSVILIADLLGIVPKKDAIMLDARKKICETLAVQLSVAASQSNFEFVKSTLDIFVARNDDVIAASMSKSNGSVVAQFGDFLEYDINTVYDEETKSTADVVVVPIFAGVVKWGTVNVEFKSIYASGTFSLLTDSILGILLFVAVACFAGYLFILKKALRVLDPKSVVPDRVRNAFNTLSEGVMIIDDKEQIIMANNAFAEKVKRKPEDLLGVNASSLKWKYINRDQRSTGKKMPWANTIADGLNNIGVPLKLSTQGAGVRSLSTNSAPILDDKGKTRGALVTFDDVTEIEETNVLLENAVSTLKQSELEVNRKNSELEVLATRDPLTGCYNRRAFFDLFENAYDDAEKSQKPLTCLMVDIDHFKSINDRFGHAIGDEAIRIIADVLNNNCSYETAIVGRYGGEEFCIAFPGADMDQAANVAERLRQIIMKASKDFCAKNVTITASFGVSCKSGSVSNCSQMLELADKALYVAKESGRNKIIRWGENDDVAATDKAVIVHVDDSESNNGGKFLSEDDEKISILKDQVETLKDKLQRLGESSGVDEVSNIDSITKLPSQLIFMDRIDQAAAYSLRANKLVAVAVFNIDMFSRINDTMGKAIGNEFLRAVGQRLKAILRRSDTVATLMSPGQAGPSLARLKDDEFALLITGLDDLESLSYVIKRIQKKFSGKIEVSGNDIYVTTSIGISMFPKDGEGAEILIENARRAQKQAKLLTGGNNYQFYSLADNSKVIEQMQIEIDMHNALEEQQFVLYYQPKMDMKTGDVVSMEALIRWQHPTRGMLFPDTFIPVAEKTGMIVDMGKWCLLEACTQTKRWVDMGAPDIRTSVNVSTIEFADTDFKANVFDALKASQLDARNLEIEITESTIMADPGAAQRLIEDLRFNGVTVTLDDFGTGYSSLSYFGNLELDWLKLDRSFLLEAMASERACTIYSSIVKMVHATGVKVVSEGVETQAEYDYIKGLDVDELQGYLLSKPLTADKMAEMIFPDEDKRMEM